MKKLIILILLAVGVTVLTQNDEYVEIPSSSIRMRVIANSDSETDQKNKIIIKSVVDEILYDITKGLTDIEEVDEKIIEHKSLIDEKIQNTIDEYAMNVSFESSYGDNYFPEKEFKGAVYKAGNYKSFVVTLGSGEGENWWCVLYPPLCLVDENVDDYDYHSIIKDMIEKYN